MYFEDMVHSESFRNSNLIHPDHVRGLVEEVVQKKDATFAMGEQAFSALYPYLWEQYVLKRP